MNMETTPDARASLKVISRINKAENGNLGDTKPVGDGVHEMRIDYGPGYRIYFAHDGFKIIVLFCGGDKRTQQKDIDTAKKYWSKYKEEKRGHYADSKS